MLAGLGGPRGNWLDYDYKEWRIVARCLRKFARTRGFTSKIPKCTGAHDFDAWLEELNFLIGRKENLADGRRYQLIDLAHGLDCYTILFCPVGYKVPKWGIWTEEKEEAFNKGDPN
jgi:hypothetical protein